jgi:hypothetical protein
MGGKTAGAGAAPNPYLSGAVVAPGQAGGAAGVTGLRSSNLASALSGLGKKPNTPPTPQARPAPPPVPTGTGKLTTPAAPGTDPLRAYGASVPGGPLPGNAAPPDYMARPATGTQFDAMGRPIDPMTGQAYGLLEDKVSAMRVGSTGTRNKRSSGGTTY